MPAESPAPMNVVLIEDETLVRHMLRKTIEKAGGLPDIVVACVGGGSNAIGLFTAFIGDESVRLVGVEAGGRGPGLGDNAARMPTGKPGVLHGTYSLLLQDADGQV